MLHKEMDRADHYLESLIRMKNFKLLLILLVISGIVFSAFTPVQTKESPCCSCCKGSVCMCACNDKGADRTVFRGTQKDRARGRCDFNTCNNKDPLTTGNIFFLNSSNDVLKKKLVLVLQTCISAEGACLFAKIFDHNLYSAHLSLPPPLFLKHSSLLL
jgi:hypothetical protein